MTETCKRFIRHSRCALESPRCLAVKVREGIREGGVAVKRRRRRRRERREKRDANNEGEE